MNRVLMGIEHSLFCRDETMLFEIGLFILLGMICQFVGTIVLAFQSSPLDVRPLAVAVVVCFATSIPPIIAWHTSFARKNPAALPLVTVGWRMGLLLVVLAVSAATKWPSHISFCFSLLGCYFPFLLLESSLSMRRIRLETRNRG